MLLTAAYAAAVLSNAALGTHISRYERDTESSVSEGVCGVVKSGTDWSMETTGDCVTFLDDVLEPCKGPSALYCEYLDFSFKLPSTGVATTQYSDQLRSSNMNGREPGSSTTSLSTSRSSIEITSRQTPRTSTPFRARITSSAQETLSVRPGTMGATSTAALSVSSTSTQPTLCVVKESDLDQGVCYCLDQTIVQYSSSVCKVFGD
ncbi:hypothetical protein AnigIFM63604_004533 [Aspergillus niger]|uniref:Uncharacterized protein n=1 Tax=Aspergillus niger TaxID=5061 RepID=A0A9W6EEK8_ASPNG|nr:hypothetical protein AnigIFM63604_004533 [Aspergillus niger]